MPSPAAKSPVVPPSTPCESVVEREAEYRRRLMDQNLGGEVAYADHGPPDFEYWREAWMAPQCAVLQRILEILEEDHGLEAEGLSPFLEIGGFSAHLSGYLATRHGMHGFCGELDPAVVERSFREILPKLGMTSHGLTARRAEAARLDFPDESLSFVLCFSSVHHFEDPAACLREIRRVLRPGGAFVCAWEPIQPRWRASRRPTACSEVEAGLIENVFTVGEYDALIRLAFPTFVSLPHDSIRLPGFLPGAVRRGLGAALEAEGRRSVRRAVIDRFGGQDYSAIAIR